MSKEDLRLRVAHNFAYHRPQNQVTQDIMQMFREQFGTLAQTCVDYVPEGRELSMALTDLERGLMSAIAGLARNEDRLLEQVAKGSNE